MEIVLALVVALQRPGEVTPARPELGVRQALNPLNDAKLIDFVRRPFDPMSDEARWPRALGTHHGVPVIVSYTCSDVCPNYTKRIVHYDLAPGEECERAGGISKDIVVPSGIGTGLRRFCIPAPTDPYQQ
ncbi:hypothetical protein [Brevundimonas sp. Root1423]|uniref:hypothetical protein n=1 Tax=Brevundimonas sp. Root1423 TaxID=1736462 RepID=UPI001F312A99|nr:hypothetical protein [Brevundimonas sp. Root1423]